jgi:uncharacterized protein (TIRG00374 family)
VKKSNALKHWRWIPGVGISLIAVIALISFVGIGESLREIQSIPPPYVAITALFTLLFLTVRSLGWKALLSEHATFKETFLKVNEGYFINNIFPFRLGEISRALFMGNTLAIHPAKILSSIVVERVFDLIILAILILTMLPYAFGLDINQAYIWVLLITMVLGLLILIFMVRNQDFVIKQLTRLGKKIPLLEKMVLPLVYSFLDGFNVLTKPSQFVFGFLGVSGSWFISLIQYSLFLKLMVPEADWWWGAFSNVAMALGIALPSAPGGVGIFEGTIIAVLKLFEINETTALAYALVLHVVHFLITAVIGLFALYRDGISLKGLFSRLLNQELKSSKSQYRGEINE